MKKILILLGLFISFSGYSQKWSTIYRVLPKAEVTDDLEVLVSEDSAYVVTVGVLKTAVKDSSFVSVDVSGDITVGGTVDGIDIATDVAANTSKTGITTGQANEITANTSKVVITTSQANEITANTSKVVITTNQSDAIVVNTAKDGITSGQASAITANTAKETNATHSGEVTGSAALTIADGVIEAANMESTNSPTDNQIWSYDQSSLGGTWVDNGSGSGDLLSTNNLSDLVNDPTAVANLGFTATVSEINTPLDGATVTLTEFRELETIGDYTISAHQWDILGGLSATLAASELNLVENVTSNIQLQLNDKLDEDGTIPLTANWDVGAYTITGTQFVSDIAIGTAPLVVTSTTVVTNLNADLLDGLSGDEYLAIADTVGLIAGTNITFTEGTNTLTINSTGGSASDSSFASIEIDSVNALTDTVYFNDPIKANVTATNAKETTLLGINAWTVKASYIFADDGGAITTDSLSLDVSVPSGAVITRVITRTNTAFTSAGSATVAINVGDTEVLAATAFDNAAFVGVDVQYSTPVEASGDINIDIAVAALTAGDYDIWVEYLK